MRRLVDLHSRELLQLSAFFSPDLIVAERMVVRCWLVALPGLLLRDVAGGGRPDDHDHRTILVRALAVGDPDDPEVADSARALRLAVRGDGCFVPAQTRAVPPAASGPHDLAARLRELPGPLRLVLLLTDAQGWPSGDVEELLEVRPAARRRLLALARDQVCHGVRPSRAG